MLQFANQAPLKKKKKCLRLILKGITNVSLKLYFVGKQLCNDFQQEHPWSKRISEIEK